MYFKFVTRNYFLSLFTLSPSLRNWGSRVNCVNARVSPGLQAPNGKLNGGEFMPEIQRRRAVTVNIGGIRVGSDAPVVVQSMTNTDTADVESTVQQVAALARAGSEMVRVTVNNDEAAKAVPAIVEELAKKGWTTPIIGDFHYNGHQLLTKIGRASCRER